MKLPNGAKAQIDQSKLAGYCLNEEHPRGKHKARVFQSVFGIGPSDVDFLAYELRRAARVSEAVPGETDEHGTRYSIRFEMETTAGRGTVHSAWIIRVGEDFPRLITCYALPQEGGTEHE